MNVIKTYTQKILIPCWLVLLIVIFFDISTRLTNIEIKQSLPWQVADQAKSGAFSLNQEQAKAIAEAINNYEVSSEIETAVDNTMSEAEQRAQQGDLNQLFSGNKRYRLIGIFDNNERFAVIKQLDVTVNTEKLIKVTIADSLQDYKVTKILANKVILNSGDKREITLFLYQQLEKAIKE